MSRENDAQTTVRAVDRALDILLCFANATDGLTMSELSRAVGLHKSTVHRLLTSLQRKGFVRKHPYNDKYLVGWSVLELIRQVYQSDDLPAVVLPEMTRLRDETGETVILYIRSGIERIRIQAVESHEPIRNVASIGKKYPLYIGASGKVLLAYADDKVVETVFSDVHFPQGMSKTELTRQLVEIRKDGCAISIQERDAGAAAIAAPVFDKAGHILAALSVTGPVSRLTTSRMAEHIETLKKSAAWMTKLISYDYHPTHGGD